ncbi:MAG: hypothetical protein Q4E06_05745 [Lautropia sp.]|nr:hypothetical protein [Lautropia sp.]
MDARVRILVKLMMLVLPVFVAAASPVMGSMLLMLPVGVGVGLCAWRAIQGALKDGWLAEI